MGLLTLTTANRAPYHHPARREYLPNIVEFFGVAASTRRAPSHSRFGFHTRSVDVRGHEERFAYFGLVDYGIR
jgi:hypothetical protein